jgi:membrane-bound lytic murein transglycosylase B
MRFLYTFFLKSAVFLLVVLFVLPTYFSIGSAVVLAAEDSVAEREAQLRKELAQTEAEIAQWASVLNEKRKETGSIKRDAEILAAKIEQAKLVIKAKNLAIQTLGKDISQKEVTIASLNKKIEEGKESLSELIRKTNEMDSYSIAEVTLSNKDVSEFFSSVDSYDSIQRSLEDLFNEIQENKKKTESEKAMLGAKRDEETNARVAVETEKRSVEKTEAEKKELLRISQNQEKTYEQVLADRQRKAAQIRSALFALRDTAAIPFGTALTYANKVSEKVGVRPAFLLAILTQETNLGENIGTCNRPGDPVSKQWQAIMPGPADIAAGKSKRNDEAAYLRIIGELGFDPGSMPLSCPWNGGWGGAMGPSQFIPTTWEAYQSKVKTALGKTKVNPWEPEDAFMASGIYLSELGASARTWTAERTAALKYYAGGNWNNPANAFYGNQVMVKAQTIQETMIDPLQGL